MMRRKERVNFNFHKFSCRIEEIRRGDGIEFS